jgi:hypothetical protein
MTASDVATIDFSQVKRRLMGSSEDNPVNCAVALYGAKSVGFLVDKSKSIKSLAVQLRKEAPTGNGAYFYGTAFIDSYPGALRLNLNKAPDSLASRLRYALRGSGFGSVTVTISENPME